MAKRPARTSAGVRAQARRLLAEGKALAEKERRHRLMVSALALSGIADALDVAFPFPSGVSASERKEWAKEIIAFLGQGKAPESQGEATKDKASCNRLEPVSLRPMPEPGDKESPYPAFLLREALHGKEFSPEVAKAAAAWREAVSDLGRIRALRDALLARFAELQGEEARRVRGALSSAEAQLRHASAMKKNQPDAEGKR